MDLILGSEMGNYIFIPLGGGGNFFFTPLSINER